jgi:hypothetical protein
MINFTYSVCIGIIMKMIIYIYFGYGWLQISNWE